MCTIAIEYRDTAVTQTKGKWDGRSKLIFKNSTTNFNALLTSLDNTKHE